MSTPASPRRGTSEKAREHGTTAGCSCAPCPRPLVEYYGLTMEHAPPIPTSRRNLGLLMAGQFVSVLGDWFFHIAVMWMVYSVTESPRITGIIAASSFLGMFLVGPFAGAIVDRFDYRKLMLVTESTQMLLSFAIPAMAFAGYFSEDSTEIWPIVVVGVVSFLLNVCAALFVSARDSLIPLIVENKELSRYNAMVQGSGQSGAFLGPLLAGVLLPWTGSVFLFFANGVTFGISVLLLAMMRLERSNLDAYDAYDASSPRQPLTADIGDLVRYIGGHRPLFILLVITFVNNIFIMGPAMVGMPIFVKTFVETSTPDGLYSLGQAMIGLGMLVTSAVISRYGLPKAMGIVWGIGLILDGLTWAPVGLVRSPEWFLGLVLLHALTIPILIVPRTTMIQRLVPQQMRGRVFSLVHVAVFGCTALSNLLIGFLAEVITMDQLYIIIGIGGGVTGGIGLLVPSLRQIRDEEG